MIITSWLTSLLRNKKRHTRQQNALINRHLYGWQQFDQLEDRTLLSAPEFDFVATFGGVENDDGVEVAVDSSGNSFIAGHFFESADLDPSAGEVNHVSNGLSDVYIVKLNEEGDRLWSRSFGGSSYETVSGMQATPDDGVVLTGSFRGTVDFAPGPDTHEIVSTNNGVDTYILKLDSSGQFEWVRTLGSSSYEQSYDLTVDSASNIYVTGRFDGDSGPLTFNYGSIPYSLTGFGGSDAYVIKLDSQGQFQWGKTLGGSGRDEGEGIAIDSFGNVFTTGFFEGTADFDPGTGTFDLSSNGGRDVFINKLNNNGEFVWTRTLGTTSSEEVIGIEVDSSGNVVLLGKFEGTVDFDPGAGTSNSTSLGGTDIFVLKLNASGNHIWSQTYGSDRADHATGLEVDHTGIIYIAANASQGTDLDPGSGVINLSDTANSYVLILNDDGTYKQSVNYGDDGYTFTRRIVVDQNKNIFVVGPFQNSPDFDPGVGTTSRESFGDQDGYILKLSQKLETESDLAITNVAHEATVEQGAQHSYTITVSNESGDDVTDALIQNNVAAFMTNISWTAVLSGGATGSDSGNSPLNEIVELPVGATITYTLTGTIKQSVRDIITNLATVSSASRADPDLSNNRATHNDFVVLTSAPAPGFFINSAQELSDDSTRDVELADLDNDGDLDIIFANISEWSRIWFNNGDGTFTESSQRIPSGAGVAVGDLDGDEDLDIIIARGSSRSFPDAVWLNDGSGQFTDGGQNLSNEISRTVRLGDLDGDGDLDAVVTTNDSTHGNRIYFNDGHANFTDSGQSLAENIDGNRWGVDLGDLDGDGDLDAIMTDSSGEGLVYLNVGDGIFTLYHTLALTSNDLASVQLGDVDGDGDLDAFITRLYNPDVLMTNDGTGIFTITQEFYVYNGMGWEGDFGDFDGDGDLDLMVTGGSLSFTSVWWNDGFGRFTDSQQQLGLGSAISVAFGDLDGDNDLDAVITKNGNSHNEVWLNQYLTVPFHEDFQAGHRGNFLMNLPENFSYLERRDGNRLLSVGVRDPEGVSVATLKTDLPLLEKLELSVEVTPLSYPDHWADGFLVFDYQSNSDFKYAGFFAGKNQWVVGHYQGDWKNRLAQVDWDENGRRIDIGTAYTLHLTIDGDNVALSVDNKLMMQATFTEPINEGRIGLATYNAVSLFDNLIVGEDVDQGAPLVLPYREDFNDGSSDQFEFDQPESWSIQSSDDEVFLQVDASEYKGLRIGHLNFDRPMPNSYEMSAFVTSMGGPNRWLDGFLIFDYQSPTNFKYAGMFTGVNQWVIGHYQGNWTNRLAQVDLDDVGNQIYASKAYTLHVTVDDNDVELRVDGIPTLSATFASGITNGTVGVAAQNAVTRFDNLHIDLDVPQGKELPLPYSDDFNDGAAQDFYYNLPGAWGIANFGAEKVLRVNTAGSGRTGLAFVPIDSTDAEAIKVSVDVRSNQVTNGWNDAFVIFDYKNENDFKYVGFYTGQNEWVLGHFQGNWNNRFDTLDWDGSGRKINFNQFYHLELHMDNDYLIFSVDGEEIFNYFFDSQIEKGAVGVAAANAFSWFDNFTVEEAGPLVIPIASPIADPVFANWDEESDDLLS
ncbi:FG-GAP repeat protein [Polystyrenella longa]|uniref:FG-GAP repeat protein n=1 Tax=Polystyrenella longa TaxID=2528007 RepID=A0A518CGL1_9PLAN|nr:FG-GAP-like repeat-containing protein [Polystyrenella longa]QDU78366.1 FG-GAP repeat protein [Polystyrenella longa]